MLDIDETASFDEAMRRDPELKNACREIDRLAAAVAVTATVPITPRAGQLEHLYSRLGLGSAKRTNWPGISGWAAAAVLMMILVIARTTARENANAQNTRIYPPVTPHGESAIPDAPPEEDQKSVQQTSSEDSQKNELPVASRDGDGKVIAKAETKKLIQEIEVLRGKLENFQERDRQRFETVPGMAWPVVMRMVPPGVASGTHGLLSLKKDDPTLTAMLGDALIAANSPAAMADSSAIATGDSATPQADPSAIPIYDAARDSGTLVVNNLPVPTADEVYNLWVTTKQGATPVYLGRLPSANGQGVDSFDFSLGSKTTVPLGFAMTKDLQGKPVIPNKDNTVLQGPH